MVPKALAAVAVLVILSEVSSAEVNQKKIGTFDDWLVYSYEGPSSKVCFVSSTPKASEPKNVKRDQAFLYVTHMPNEKPPVRGEVSTVFGYSTKAGVTVRLMIDGKLYKMFTKEDTAWADPGSDKRIIAAMKVGKMLTVEGTSSKGTKTVYTYSLKGISDALAALDKVCK